MDFLRGHARGRAWAGSLSTASLRRVAIGALEEAHLDLDGEHLTHHVVHHLDGQLAGLDEAGQVLQIGVAAHVHAHAAAQATRSRVHFVAGIAVHAQRMHGPGVADHEALEAHLLPQQVAQQPGIAEAGTSLRVM